MRRRVKAKWDSCQTTQNLEQETENVRETLRAPDRPCPHGSSTPIKHAFPQGCSALQKDSPLSIRNETENSGLGPLGEMPEGGEAQPNWNVIHQLWQSHGHMVIFWQGAKSFLGGAGRGPCAASADLWGRLSQGYDVLEAKVQEIFIGNLDKGGGGQLSTGQHPVG